MANPTVQNIIDGVSQDVRKYLDSTVSADQAVLIDYTNRVHLELLREVRWRFLISGVKTFNTVVGSTDYWIGATAGNTPPQVDTGLNITDFGQLKYGTVFDRTNNRRLGKTDEAPLGSEWSGNSIPKVARNDAATPNVINLYPPPQGVYAIEFRYFAAKKQLTALSDVLQIPNDYRDVVIAGVNAMIYLYIHDDKSDAAVWDQIYQKGIRGIHRDQHLWPRGPEFISPDPASLARPGIIPQGLDSGIESSLP